MIKINLLFYFLKEKIVAFEGEKEKKIVNLRREDNS
jgi:hypothetical protein